MSVNALNVVRVLDFTWFYNTCFPQNPIATSLILKRKPALPIGQSVGPCYRPQMAVYSQETFRKGGVESLSGKEQKPCTRP